MSDHINEASWEMSVGKPSLAKAAELLPCCTFHTPIYLGAGHSTCRVSVPGFTDDPIVHIQLLAFHLQDPVDSIVALREYVFRMAVAACKTPPSPEALSAMLGGEFDEEARALARKMGRELADEATNDLLVANERLEDNKRRHAEACSRAEAKHKMAWAYLEAQEPTPCQARPAWAPTLASDQERRDNKRLSMTPATKRITTLPPLVDLGDDGPSVSDLIIQARRGCSCSGDDD